MVAAARAGSGQLKEVWVVDAAPFRALRYDPRLAGGPASTSAPAYDELTRFAYAQHHTASPYTVVELMTGVTDDDPNRYVPAAAAYERWRRTGVLKQDPEPAFYRYEQHWLRHGVPAVQRGLVAAVHLDDDAVLTHEHVDPARVRERLARLAAVPVDLSPVFAVYAHAPPELAGLLAAPPDRPPIVALTDEEGVDHRVWPLTDPQSIAAVREALRPVRVVIADGHHRYATALAYRDAHPAVESEADAEAPWQRSLMHLVDATVAGPEVLGVHRLARTLPDRWLDRLPPGLRVAAAVTDVNDLLAALEACEEHAIGLLIHADAARRAGLDATGDGLRGYVLSAGHAELRPLLPPGHAEPWYRLDAALLQHVVLPAVGLDPASLANRVDARQAAAEVSAAAADGLFLLRPVSAETVFEVAASGDTMPAKTTWFRPKPRTGLLLRPLAPPPLHSGTDDHP
jgi:uncharacterized protein (DUF1015 family)